MKFEFRKSTGQNSSWKKSRISGQTREKFKAAMETLEQRTLLSAISYSYVTDQSNYQAALGQTVTVNVYIKETLNGNTSIIDGHGENGLFGAGFEVVSGTRPPTPSLITAINYDATDFTGLNGVQLNDVSVSNPNEADLAESISFSAPTGVQLANGNGAAANEVFLGSLTIVAGASAGTTTFSLGERSIGGLTGSNTITNLDGYDLDVSSNTPAPYTGVGSTVTTFSVTAGNPVPPTPVITVSTTNRVFDGTGFTPSAVVSGTSGTDNSAALTYTYYSGTGANAPSLGSTAPSNVGTYLVVAHFAGDSTYSAADSAPKEFQISTATASVFVSDPGGVVTGQPFVASATVAGSDGARVASLEGVSPTIAYYSGSTATGTALPGAPSALGTYTVVASFAGSTDYAAAVSAPVTFSITSAVVTNPPVIAAQSFVLNSKAVSGAVVGTVAASDPSGLTPIFSIQADPTPQAFDFSGAFQIDAQGVVTLTNPAGLPLVGKGQTKNATFQVTVADPDDSELASSAIMTVRLSPVQTMPPILTAPSAAFTSPEAGKKGVKIGTVAAGPAYLGQKIAYLLTGDDAAFFSINARGLITSKTALDYLHSAGHSYSFNVVAVDRKSKGVGSQSATVPVTLNISDVAPTITRTLAGQVVKAGKAISPFKKAKLDDVVAAHIDTLTITLDNPANGAFTPASLAAGRGVSWTADSTAGTYTASSTAAILTKAIAKLSFLPTPGPVAGQTGTTTFTLSLGDGAATTNDSTTTVIAPVAG